MSASEQQSLVELPVLDGDSGPRPPMPVPLADHSDDVRGDRERESGEETEEEEYFWEDGAPERPVQSSSEPKKRKSSNRVRAILLDKPQRTSKSLAPHDAAFKAAVERGLEVGERPKRRSVPTQRFGTHHSKTPTLHLERDAAIMQQVLEKRPYLIHRPNAEKELIAMVVKALKSNVVWSVTKSSVQNQIKWLVHVLLDEQHAEHDNLVAADGLRDMVKEYHDVSDAILEDIVEKMNNIGADKKVTFDDVLLRGVQRWNPFSERRRRSAIAAWDRVAASLNDELQVKVFFSGTSCKDRVMRLRAVTRGRHDPFIDLSSAQRAMLDELETELGGKRRRDSVDDDDDDSIPMDIDIQSLETENELSDLEEERKSKHFVKRSRRQPTKVPATEESEIRPGMEANPKDSKVEEVATADERFVFEPNRTGLEERVACLERELRALHHSHASLSAEWMQRLDTERSLHREQLGHVLSLLRAEREAQREETRALLDTVAAERRGQFQALMNTLLVGEPTRTTSDAYGDRQWYTRG